VLIGNVMFRIDCFICIINYPAVCDLLGRSVHMEVMMYDSKPQQALCAIGLICGLCVVVELLACGFSVSCGCCASAIMRSRVTRDGASWCAVRG
jgi:hypothetical protein